MPTAAAIPGAFFCFAAFVFLLFVSISVPTWHRVSFLNVGPPDATTRFGVFGATGHSPSVGYHFDATGVTYESGAVNSDVMYNLTKTLIMHPIVCALAFLGFLAGLIGGLCHRAGLLIMTALASLAAFTILVAFVLDMVIFCLTRSHFKTEGVDASLGNANWLTLAALFSLIFASVASAIAIFARSRRRKEMYY